MARGSGKLISLNADKTETMVYALTAELLQITEKRKSYEAGEELQVFVISNSCHGLWVEAEMISKPGLWQHGRSGRIYNRGDV